MRSSRILLSSACLCLSVIILGSCSACSSAAHETQNASPPAASDKAGDTSPSTDEQAPALDSDVVYNNPDYGFKFELPKTWEGYTVVTETWTGTPLAEGRQSESGPQFLIRSPKWTDAIPTQDTPIMVFTRAQWDALQREEFSVSAAPIPPSELGRNNQYVFALPARYNFAFLPGYEEVADIIDGQPLQTYDMK
jgi:hypothetical protein